MSDAILSAVVWLEQLMLGPTATFIAVLAVAALGFQMMTGRIDRRRGASIVLGCFIIFGAGQIASGLSAWHDVPPAVVVAHPAKIEAPLPPSNFDPYAGAAPMLKPV